jgi:fucose permease
MVPGASSTVSALMMGFAWGAGALMAPVTGIISHRTGFIQALLLISLLPLISALLLWLYPKDGASPHEVVLNSQTEALAMD